MQSLIACKSHDVAGFARAQRISYIKGWYNTLTFCVLKKRAVDLERSDAVLQVRSTGGRSKHLSPAFW